MSVAELLTELRKLDAYIVLDGDRLRLNAPTGVLTEQHRHQLQSRKQEIVDFLRAAQQLASQQRALIPLIAHGSRIPIFAVAGHNGDVFCYRSIAGHLGSDQPFYGLQPPGHEEGTEPSRSVGSLAEYFADQIRAFRTHGPMTVAGFCAGGTVAFELARQLKANGAEVRNLVLFGAPYATSYRRLPQLIATTAYLAQRSIVHARALMSSGNRAHYLSDRLKVFQPDRRSTAGRSCSGATRRHRSGDDRCRSRLQAAVLRRPPGSDAPLRGLEVFVRCSAALAESCAHVSGVRRTG